MVKHHELGQSPFPHTRQCRGPSLVFVFVVDFHCNDHCSAALSCDSRGFARTPRLGGGLASIALSGKHTLIAHIW